MRRSAESFVSWKEATGAARRKGSDTDVATKSIVSGQTKSQSRLSTSGPVPCGPLTVCTNASPRDELSLEKTRSEETKGRQLPHSGRKENNVTKTRKGNKHVPNSFLNKERTVEKEAMEAPSSAHVRRCSSSGEESSLKSVSTGTLKSMTTANALRSSATVHAYSDREKRTPEERRTGLIHAEVGSLGKEDSTSLCGRRFRDANGSRRQPRMSPGIKEIDEEVSSEDVGDLGEDSIYSAQRQPKQSQQQMDVDNNEFTHISLGNNEDVAPAEYAVHARGMQERNKAMDLQETALMEESGRRRERRQAQALREKDRRKRQKEGLPTNFLMVDKYTKKPYGVGVGDWRKELMLLSRKLDPAIGNINQQPEGAVAEIAEWIQHTWEYSSPIKFAFVKEVIARGVSLRRADMWKKIRNQEPKPEELSDKSWRILAKQMRSPATMRESESCSRANASKVYFGRTGPSGEVGVRQRLQRILRRSPDPEEIRFEMARDKGYGGRLKAKKEDMNVNHRSEGNGQLALQMARSSSPIGNYNDNNDVGYDSEGQLHDAGDDAVEEFTIDGDTGDKIEGGCVLALSDVQITEHPLVKRMMERLEALEGKNKAVMEDGSAAPTEKVKDAHSEEESEAAGNTTTADVVEGPAEDNISEGEGGTRKPGRPKKRSKHM